VLDVDAELTAATADLKSRISDVRDYMISHEKSPRTTTATKWDRDDRLAQIAMMRLYPRATDPQQFDSEPLPALREAIHEYLSRVVDFITTNETMTALNSSNRAGSKNGASNNKIDSLRWHLSAVLVLMERFSSGRFSSTASGLDQGVQRSSATKSSATSASRSKTAVILLLNEPLPTQSHPSTSARQLSRYIPEIEIGSIGVQYAAGGVYFWRWAIDTVVPMREVGAQGMAKDRKDCMRKFRAA